MKQQKYKVLTPSDVEVVYGRICKEVEARMAPFQDAPCDLSLKPNKILVEPTGTRTNTAIQIFLLFLAWLEIRQEFRFLFSSSKQN